MSQLIYQVYVGKKSRLYDACIASTKRYCEKHGIDHIVQTAPKLRIKPNVFSTNRSRESYEKHGGFLPIYEKENAFDHLKDYDQVAIVDADIYIRENATNIFDDFGTGHAFGAVLEASMPINLEYQKKIINYSAMQYSGLHAKGFYPNAGRFGFPFYNMGMMLMNSDKFLPYLKGKNAKQWIESTEFAPFVDGLGNWKWSTDQTLLNYWVRRYNVPTKDMDWKWNGLYTANKRINECSFVHFFLKDKLPNRGENIEALLRDIGEA